MRNKALMGWRSHRGGCDSAISSAVIPMIKTIEGQFKIQSTLNLRLILSNELFIVENLSFIILPGMQ